LPAAGRGLAVVVVLLAALAAATERTAAWAQSQSRPAAESLAGRLLVAPRDMPDPRFAGSVVYMLEHNDQGALGLIVNRVLGEASNSNLHSQLGLDAPKAEKWLRLFYGGPVDPNRVMVLHGADFRAADTQTVNGGIAVTGLRSVLAALAGHGGPKKYLICAGYAGWAGGQLEAELAREDWRISDGDAALVLDNHVADKWRRAMERAEQKL
jgi:putative transcriptional regulator